MTVPKENHAQLAILAVEAISRRWSKPPNSPMDEHEREMWGRAVMDGDALVYLEAAYDYWQTSETPWRPSPMQMRKHAAGWIPNSGPSVSLPAAVRYINDKLGFDDSPGLLAVVKRFGSERFEKLRGVDDLRPRPSDEKSWREAWRDHIVHVEARRRMTLRGTLPWSESEAKGFNVTAPIVAALVQPAARDCAAIGEFASKINKLHQGAGMLAEHKEEKQ